MGMEIEVTNAAQVEETLISDKENEATPTSAQLKDNSDSVVPTTDLEAAKKEGGIEATQSSILPPKDATDEWDAPKQTHTFYFAKIRMIEDPKVKTKLDQLHKTINNNKAQKGNLLSQLADKRKERNEIIKQLKPLTDKVREFNRIMNEKRTAMEPLRDELGKIRYETYAIKEKGMGLCSSVKELDDLLRSLEYRMSHESMSLDEEKRLMKEMKQLEGTRARVVANAASRAKFDHDNDKLDLQDKVKLIGVDLDGVRKEKEVIRAQIKPLEDQKIPIEHSIKSLEDQLNDINERNKKAYDSVVGLNSGKESLNIVFTENRKMLTQAKVLASKKDVAALEALANTEMEKFMAQWGKKAFREDYEKRILSSLDQRLLSRDGRIRNPDEKPIIAPEPIKAAEPAPTSAALPKPAPTKHSKEEEAVAKAVEVKPKDGTNLEVESAKKKEKEKEKEKEKVDLEKLKELKREEEIAKNKMALERKKKLAEKKLAKAEVKALKEAEEKLKKKEKKAKRKGAVWAPEGSEEVTETEPNAEESVEPEDESKDESDPASAKAKPQKESAAAVVRQRGGVKKGQSQLPRAILRRKKSHTYWSSWAPLSAMAALVLAVLLGGSAYWYKYYYLASEKIEA